MADEHYPLIQISGPPYERGFQHGRQARDRVATSVEIYRRAFKRSNRLEWPEVIERARGFATQIASLDAGILEEMRGIADGSGFKLEEIVAINCRTEILFGTRPSAAAGPAHECTTIAVAPWASASGGTIVGKNWDWKAACRDSVIIVQVEQPEAPNFVMVVEAGMVGRDGMNDAGIAVTGNLLRSTLDGTKPGVPVPMLRRRVLNSSRFDDALGAVINAERAASTNYLLAHESGVIIDLEAAPDEAYPVYPERGLLTHSNHFLHLAAQVRGIGKLTAPDTLYRHQRARDLLESKIGAITVEDIQAALRDHVGLPRAICRHPDEREADPTMSIASVIIDLGARTLHVASGPPCCHAYRAVYLPGDPRGVEAETQAHAGTLAG